MTKIIKFFKSHPNFGYILLLFVGLTAGLVVAPLIKSKLASTSEPSQNKTYQVQGISISTTLPQPASDEIASFLRTVMPTSSLPTQLTVSLQNKGKDGRGDEYAGGWSLGGKFYNVLYVNADSNKPEYLRAWYFGTMEEINQDRSTALLKGIFLEGKVNEVGKLNCKEQTDDKDQKFVVCDAMKTNSSGAKEGLLVRSPLLLKDETKVTLISSCSVPKESKSFDSILFCI